MTPTVYWAETSMGMPYEAPDAGPLNMLYARSLAGKCALTGLFAAIGVFGALSLTAEAPPVQVVVLAGYEPPAESAAPVNVAHAAPAPAKSAPPVVQSGPVSVPKTESATPGPQISTAPAASLPADTALVLRPASKPTEVAAPSLKTPVQDVYSYLSHKESREAARQAELKKVAAEAAAAKAAAAREKATEKPPAEAVATTEPKSRKTTDNAQAPAAKQPSPKVAATPAVKPAAAAERSDKPVDIASASKFSLTNIAPDSVTLFNGAKIALGGRLPNGEILQRIDPAKGRIETDQRVMIVTP